MKKNVKKKINLLKKKRERSDEIRQFLSRRRINLFCV